MNKLVLVINASASCIERIARNRLCRACPVELRVVPQRRSDLAVLKYAKRLREGGRAVILVTMDQGLALEARMKGIQTILLETPSRVETRYRVEVRGDRVVLHRYVYRVPKRVKKEELYTLFLRKLRTLKPYREFMSQVKVIPRR